MEVGWIILPFLALLCPSSSSSAGQLNDSQAPALQTEYFAEGKDANISCSNRTWSDALHFIWKINISGVNCLISESTKNPPHNNCTGGKTLRNTTNGESYLHIPHFGVKDEGIYSCEIVYRGGAETVTITVRAAVTPVLSTRLEQDSGQRFAVCSAAGGKPAAIVSWEEMWGSSEVTERSTQNADGTVTVESWLRVPDGTKDKLTCVASHLFWTRGASSAAVDLTEIRDAGSLAGELWQLIMISFFFVLSLVIVTFLSIYMCLERHN
ncbi:cell surface glycoprotein CD200 receptor 1-like isoform X1 [Alosa sapidissima]|uniref:cell surface glycoprotein CD200 receptor 1-like isoform X1 n=1 Tax=Alosa sapidissima TaxID=34773 RepID=UPI001C08463A|nr:cell surface glycoprotein CD200 receptor 1-like isoform X1 [Alosa sapidissima]